MAALLSFLSTIPPSASQRRRFLPVTDFSFSSPPYLRSVSDNYGKRRTLFLSSSLPSSFDDLDSASNSSSAGSSEKSVLSDMIHEIEPLDVTLIQKDVPPTTLDAMKRTISSMLGLLPSDRFQVSIDALWEPLSKLLVSSMMTGYTLRNAEYRLCLERNLDINEVSHESQTPESSKFDLQEMFLSGKKIDEQSWKNNFFPELGKTIDEPSEDIGCEGFGELSPEVQHYIHRLQSQLSSAEKELCEVKRKSAALQMQQFVGEEKNDLLDYLRSLQPEKVAELSEPTCPELKETIYSVVHGLLATLSPKMHSKAPPSLENTASGVVNIGSEDCAELLENTSLQFQPHISLTRDYLARLLFWCMLLGHYLQGLEYRVELMRLLSLTSDAESSVFGDGQVA
ncbi:uncharacterized protein LOC123228219 isoform X2 [Mangifera indica]|uniref:uncharacterized protein LOC123228219 isoform X2 n=1 Tax=Mangifera indica TaxID=29780 RepID=UPI001CF93229|nr:uncharacterized protein LOC123228219 isoform X2 [Mangifera indica]